MTDQPTVQDVLDAMQAMGHDFRNNLQTIEARLHGLERRVEGLAEELGGKIDNVKADLSNEIAGAYDLHEARVQRIEREMEESS